LRGTYRKPIELPAGPHQVKLERAGSEPLERMAEVPRSGDMELKVSLRPTGKVRAAKVAEASSRRTWAVTALISGVAVAGGSVVWALWSNSKLPPLEDSLALANKEAVPGSNGSCDPNLGLNDKVKQLCLQRMTDAQNNVDKYRNWRLYGIAGTVGGVALLGVGVYLLLTAPEAEHDDRLAGVLVPDISVGPDGARLWLRGRF